MNWILATLQASIAFFDAWMSQLYDVLMLDPISTKMVRYGPPSAKSMMRLWDLQCLY